MARKKKLKPKTENQAEYIRSMSESDVTFCSGPAGSGKTSVSVGLACEYLLQQKVKKIPIVEEMNMYLTPPNVEYYTQEGIIELCPLEYMRGRNFHECFMILDEAQNATFDQIKMFITRLGRRSKAVINGDLRQSDLGSESGGLLYCMDKLRETEGISVCELTYRDIIRSGVVARILEKLNEITDVDGKII